MTAAIELLIIIIFFSDFSKIPKIISRISAIIPIFASEYQQINPYEVKADTRGTFSVLSGSINYHGAHG